ncbi:MAG: hypothetical protein ABII89_02455 [Candidatus Omnitrophota bacterium]
MSEKIPLDELLGLIKKEVDPVILEKAEERQSAVWYGKEPDYLPILVSEESLPERENYPVFDLKEQFFDPEKMLYEQLWPILDILRAKSDSVPSVRVNFGTGFLATVFGLKQEVFPDKMPWLKSHLTKDEILKLTPEKLEPIAEKGLMPDCGRFVQFYREKLYGTPVKIYLPDTQGPFDLAHLIIGDSIFTEFYDDPVFVRHILTLTAYAYRTASLKIKEWIGEAETSGYHSGTLYMSGCGVRACEDTTTLLSPDLIEVTLPFLREGLRPFGGWIHFCGRGQILLSQVLSLPEIRGVNFGNPERYPWGETVAQIVSAGKVYFGNVSRNEEESLAEYLERVLSGLKRKSNLIFQPFLKPGESAQEAVTAWRKTQDRLFG